MKSLMILTAITLVSGTASAFETCERTAQDAAKALAKINKSHARIVTDTMVSDAGDLIEVTLDNRAGGQSVTYGVTLTSTDPCQVAKVEIVGEE